MNAEIFLWFRSLSLKKTAPIWNRGMTKGNISITALPQIKSQLKSDLKSSFLMMCCWFCLQFFPSSQREIKILHKPGSLIVTWFECVVAKSVVERGEVTTKQHKPTPVRGNWQLGPGFLFCQRVTWQCLGSCYTDGEGVGINDLTFKNKKRQIFF